MAKKQNNNDNKNKKNKPTQAQPGSTHRSPWISECFKAVWFKHDCNTAILKILALQQSMVSGGLSEHQAEAEKSKARFSMNEISSFPLYTV